MKSKIVLDIVRLESAIQQLSARIAGRFPESRLAALSEQLVVRANELRTCGRRLIRAPPWIRVISWVGGVLLVGSFFILGRWLVKSQRGIEELPLFLQTVESSVTIIAAATAGFFTMRSIEHSQVRRRALEQIQWLRKIAHVIDMLQLSKSPASVMLASDPRPSSRSETVNLKPPEMFRYLSYCGELAALTGKLSVLIGAWVSDAVILSTIDDVEDLCVDLERKMLSKLLLLEQLNQRPAALKQPFGKPW